MEPDLTKVWTREEVREQLGAILVDSLGVDASAVRDDASLIQDLGAESIDFLDISFKAQQSFGVDLPTRLIQDQILEWRNLHALVRVLAERHAVNVTAEELRTVVPSTIAGIFTHLREKHGLTADDGAERGLAQALAERLLSQMRAMGLDMDDVDAGLLANLLLDNVHSPKVMEEVLRRFTVGALGRYVCDRLAAASRLPEAV
jgi:acyl carrier protein